MTLSDEDYGILYNAIEQTPHNGTNFELGRRKFEVAQILDIELTLERSRCTHIQIPSLQYLLDFASFIILSEGRELP